MNVFGSDTTIRGGAENRAPAGRPLGFETEPPACTCVIVRVRAAADALRQRRAEQPVAADSDLAHRALVRRGGDARDRAREP